MEQRLGTDGVRPLSIQCGDRARHVLPLQVSVAGRPVDGLFPAGVLPELLDVLGLCVALTPRAPWSRQQGLGQEGLLFVLLLKSKHLVSAALFSNASSPWKARLTLLARGGDPLPGRGESDTWDRVPVGSLGNRCRAGCEDASAACVTFPCLGGLPIPNPKP